jgi:hypothetical protein
MQNVATYGILVFLFWLFGDGYVSLNRQKRYRYTIILIFLQRLSTSSMYGKVDVLILQYFEALLAVSTTMVIAYRVFKVPHWLIYVEITCFIFITLHTSACFIMWIQISPYFRLDYPINYFNFWSSKNF